jgi:RES domain-containing protein
MIIRAIEPKRRILRTVVGVIFRSVSPQCARPSDILSGQGAYQLGGRWNAPGIYAIYGSLEPV